jgi:endo-1,4-beta-xylanase
MIPLFALTQDIQNVEARLMNQANENIDKYRKGDAWIQFKTADGDPLTYAQVEITQTNHDFLFGCIIFDLIRNESIYREDLFKQRFKNLFNFAVFPFYWPGYERTQGMPGWEDRLATVEWCKANGITTKGHPLVWACRSGVPEWLSGYSIAETEELSKSRVVSITRGFEGKIDIWDVVNEPVNVKTWKNKLANMDDPSDWGVEDPISDVADYVEEALHWAYTGNPAANLIINEYNTIARPDTRERFYYLLQELEHRATPISGIGIQAHEPRQEWYPPEELLKTLDLYAEFDLPIHITELHPQSAGREITGGWRTGTWNLETQKEFTEQFVRLCFGHPSVASINWWGFSDRNIWLPGGGLVDEEYEPKPVYEMLYNLIHHEWKTNFTVNLEDLGNVSFRGFYGTYDIKVTTSNGRVYVYPIHLRKDEENRWTFTVPRN